MPKKKKAAAKTEIVYHKDGTVWAKGQSIKGVPTGYWEWFRKDGTKLRSGSFENGEQVGEWTTYDKKGEVYKVTTMKRKAKRAEVADLAHLEPSDLFSAADRKVERLSFCARESAGTRE